MRLAWNRRKALYKAIPPRRCGRTAKTTGGPCRKWARVGTDVCTKHGAMAPQVVQKAEERISLAEALANGDRRPPWEVMEDTLHVADVLMRQVLLDVKETGSASAKVLEKLVSAIERANRLSKTVLDAGVAERRTRLAEGQASQMFAVFTRVLGALGLSAEQKARVPELLRREIGAVMEPAKVLNGVAVTGRANGTGSMAGARD